MTTTRPAVPTRFRLRQTIQAMQESGMATTLRDSALDDVDTLYARLAELEAALVAASPTRETPPDKNDEARDAAERARRAAQPTMITTLGVADAEVDAICADMESALRSALRRLAASVPPRESASDEAREVTTVGNIRAMLARYSDDAPIVAQVIAKDGTAWMMFLRLAHGDENHFRWEPHNPLIVQMWHHELEKMPALAAPSSDSATAPSDDEPSEGAIAAGVKAFRTRTAYWAPELLDSQDHLEVLVEEIFVTMVAATRRTTP